VYLHIPNEAVIYARFSQEIEPNTTYLFVCVELSSRSTPISSWRRISIPPGPEAVRLRFSGNIQGSFVLCYVKEARILSMNSSIRIISIQSVAA